MNYAKINTHDVANGPGIRVSLFVSGCEHRCPGCFNPETWDFGYGREFTVQQAQDIIEESRPDHIKGLSVLGGEPLHDRNLDWVQLLLDYWKKEHPNKTVWLYTGYRWEDVENYFALRFVDVLVDGPFVEAEKDLSLRFRGSRNQRIIDVKKTRETGKVVLWDEEE